MTIKNLISTIVLTATLTMGQGRDAEAALGAAIHLEETKGDYAGAIAAYRKFLAQHGSNQPLAAKAQLRLGLCYEKLGDAEARKAYERVLAVYGDQKDVAAQARARLVALKPAGAGEASFTARRIVDTGAWITGEVSRDGRWLPWGDEHGNLQIRDMRSGELRTITSEKGGWSRFIENAAISADNKRVAYAFWDTNGTDVYVANLDGTGRRMIWKRGAPKDVAVVAGWLADNRSVAVLIMSGETSRLGVIDTEKGDALRLLPELKSGYAFVCGGMSPDGRIASLLTRKSRSPRQPQTTSVLLYDIASEAELPIALPPGRYREPVFSPDGSELYFVSDRRGQFDLYALSLQQGRPSGADRLVRAGIGEVSLGGFSSAGALYYSEATRVVDIFTSSSTGPGWTVYSKPERLPLKYSGAAQAPQYSPDGRKLLYTHALGGQTWKLVIRDLASGEEREHLTEFGLFYGEWASDSRHVIINGSTDPSSGFAQWVSVRLDTQTGARQAVNLPGEIRSRDLIRVSPAGEDRLILTYRQGDDGPARLVEYDARTRQTRTLYAGSAESIVTLLAASPDGKWYVVSSQGEGENIKTLRLVPTDGAPARQLVRQQGGWFGHAVWLPDLNGFLIAAGFGGSNNVLWKFPIEEGSKPVRVLDFRMTGSVLSLHPDGKTLAFHSGWPSHDLWVASNVLPAKRP